MIRASIYAVLVCVIMTAGLIAFDLYMGKAEPFAQINKRELSGQVVQATNNSGTPEEITPTSETRSTKAFKGEPSISTVTNDQAKGLDLSPTKREPASLTVTALIRGLRNLRGQIIAQIFDKGDAFDNNKYDQALSTITISASKFNGELHFSNLTPGKYAVVLFHDENSNQQFDQSNTLIEGYAFSNNIGKSAPAKFHQAAFSAKKDKNLILNLIYH